MKAFVIAATSLALSGAALAQTATTPPADPAAAAQESADSASTAAQDAAKAAEDAAKSAGTAVEKGAEAAADVAKEAADDAATAAEDAANKAGEAMNDAAAAAENMGESAKDAAEEAAQDAGEAAKEAGQAADEAIDSATGADAAADAAVVAVPDVAAPAISASNQGILSSWVTSRHIWTTNEPSSTAWESPELAERPAEWQDIAKVDDLVMDNEGNVVGYLADIGGFLGIGAKKVLLGTDAIHLLKVGEEWFYATNFTKEELEALPPFDPESVVK